MLIPRNSINIRLHLGFEVLLAMLTQKVRKYIFKIMRDLPVSWSLIMILWLSSALALVSALTTTLHI